MTGKHVLLAAAVLVLCGWAWSSEVKDPPKPSSYAPAADLEYVIRRSVEQLGNRLEPGATYTEVVQEQVRREASGVSVYALVLANHDQANELKPAASSIAAAAAKLAEAAKDADGARQALAKLQQSLEQSSAEPLPWKNPVELETLMHYVSTPFNDLKRGVTSRRFDRSRDRTAPYASALAAIGQVSMYDESYEDDEDWLRLAGAMRDTAAAVRTAVLDEDQDTAKAALEKLEQTCAACHELYR